MIRRLSRKKFLIFSVSHFSLNIFTKHYSSPFFHVSQTSTLTALIKEEVMNCKIVLGLILCMSLVKPLELSRRRPSTAWGVQKIIFRQKLEKDYFSSKDGTYQFEYDTGNGQHQIFRNEKRYSDGTIIGFFGYIDPEGILRITEYVAGRYGYKQRIILRHPI